MSHFILSNPLNYTLGRASKVMSRFQKTVMDVWEQDEVDISVRGDEAPEGIEWIVDGDSPKYELDVGKSKEDELEEYRKSFEKKSRWERFKGFWKRLKRPPQKEQPDEGKVVMTFDIPSITQEQIDAIRGLYHHYFFSITDKILANAIDSFDGNEALPYFGTDGEVDESRAAGRFTSREIKFWRREAVWISCSKKEEEVGKETEEHWLYDNPENLRLEVRVDNGHSYLEMAEFTTYLGYILANDKRGFIFTDKQWETEEGEKIVADTAWKVWHASVISELNKDLMKGELLPEQKEAYHYLWDMVLRPHADREWCEQNNSKPSNALLFGEYGTGKSKLALELMTTKEHNLVVVPVPQNVLANYLSLQLQIKDYHERTHLAVALVVEDASGIGQVSSQGGPQEVMINSEISNLFSGVINNEELVAILITNCPDQIDPNFLELDRIGERVYLGPPGDESRGILIRNTAEGMNLESPLDVVVERYKKKTPGWTQRNTRQIFVRAPKIAAYMRRLGLIDSPEGDGPELITDKVLEMSYKSVEGAGQFRQHADISKRVGNFMRNYGATAYFGADPDSSRYAGMGFKPKNNPKKK